MDSAMRGSECRGLRGGRHRLVLLVALVVAAALAGCKSSSSSSGSSSSTTTRTITANTTQGTAIPVRSGGTAYLLTRDTSSCESDRTTLGLSGNWLKFSCNVVLGLADSSKNDVSSYSSATYVKITAYDLPDYDSNYYPTSGTYSFTANGEEVTGNYSNLDASYSPSFPDPNHIAQRTIVMYVPKAPSKASTTQTMAMGAVGMAINGVPIYDSVAANTDNIFAEVYSFDENQGHPASHSDYHYHSEPYSISYNDDNLIGVMRDGFFLYGRKDSDNTDMSTNGGSEWTSSDGDMYTYGGHVGTAPDGETNVFHYHVTKWTACYDRSGSTVYSDDGQTGSSCSIGTSSSSTTISAYFLIGHGNGGVFNTIPTAADNGGAMLNSSPAKRYYYGTPGPCTNCN